MSHEFAIRKAVAILCTAVCASIAAAASSTPQSADDQTRPIVSALFRDLIGPTRDGFKDDRKVIVFVTSTLARCLPGKVEPCMPGRAYDVAKTEAAKGAWSFGVVAEFEKSNEQSIDLTPSLSGFQFRDLIIGSREDLARSGSTTLPLAISRPIVVNRESLLVVQFARIWGWLVFMTQDGTGWRVANKVVVAIS